jgi:hypothetical protein
MNSEISVVVATSQPLSAPAPALEPPAYPANAHTLPNCESCPTAPVYLTHRQTRRPPIPMHANYRQPTARRSARVQRRCSGWGSSSALQDVVTVSQAGFFCPFLWLLGASYHYRSADPFAQLNVKQPVDISNLEAQALAADVRLQWERETRFWSRSVPLRLCRRSLI